MRRPHIRSMPPPASRPSTCRGPPTCPSPTTPPAISCPPPSEGRPLFLTEGRTKSGGTLLSRRLDLSTVGSRLLVAIKAERLAIRRSFAATGFHGGSVMRFPHSPLAIEVELLAATLASSLTATCAAPGAAYRLASIQQTTM